jgi:nudix motif 8
VSQIFHLPLSYLIDPRRLRIHKLPHRPPYYALNVTDRVNVGENVVPLHVPGSFGGGEEREVLGDPDAVVPRIEVWGLTGWYLNQFMRRLNVY